VAIIIAGFVVVVAFRVLVKGEPLPPGADAPPPARISPTLVQNPSKSAKALSFDGAAVETYPAQLKTAPSKWLGTQEELL